MTAFASAILAALPGAGAQPEKVGAGATAADGVLGVFGALLAGLAGEGDADADAAATSDAPADNAGLDLALAAASTVLPFMPLVAAVIETVDAVAASAPIDGGQPGATDDTPAVAVFDGLAAPTAAPDETATAVTSGDAPATPATPAVPMLAAAEGEPAPAVAPPPAPSPTAASPAGQTVSPTVADGARTDAAAPAGVDAQGTQSAASTALANAGAKGSATVQPAAAVVVSAPITTPAAVQAAVDAETAAANVAAVVESEAPPPTTAPATAAVAPTPARAATASASDTRRTASTAATAAKGEQAAVTAYLDGLNGAEPAVSADAATGETVVQADAGADTPVPVDGIKLDDPAGQAPGAEARPAAANVAGQLAEAPAASKASAETVAKLSADIVRKLEGQSTTFDLQLDPYGLGKVDVSVEINADGRLTASLSFESAATASDMKGRSAELRAALEQAGFDVLDSGLSFDMANQGGAGFGGGREAGEQSRTWSGRAFQRAQSGLDEADALAAVSSRSRTAAGGVDVRI